MFVLSKCIGHKFSTPTTRKEGTKDFSCMKEKKFGKVKTYRYDMASEGSGLSNKPGHFPALADTSANVCVASARLVVAGMHLPLERKEDECRSGRHKIRRHIAMQPVHLHEC